VASQRLHGALVAIFSLARTPTRSPPDVKIEHSPLAIHTTALVRALVMLVAGLDLCYGVGFQAPFTIDLKGGLEFSEGTSAK
jgi:hypothetical protein